MIYDDVSQLVRKYKTYNNKLYNPINEKELETHNQWRRSLAQCFENKDDLKLFLFSIEPPHYSVYSGKLLTINDYSLRNGFHSYTKEEIKDRVWSKIISENIQPLTESDIEHAAQKFKDSQNLNDKLWLNPFSHNIYDNRKAWIDSLSRSLNQHDKALFIYKTLPPHYSIHSQIQLNFDDFDIKKCKFAKYTKSEIQERVWMIKRKGHVVSEITRNKISKSVNNFLNSEKGKDFIQKQVIQASNFWNSDQGLDIIDKNRKINSERMKRYIADGTLDPCRSNTGWTHWTATITLNDGTVKKFRSSWEACVWFCNQHFEYENIRIHHNNHILINDFFDKNTKSLLEIKPTSRYNKEITKIQAWEQYCADNNLSFIWINEHNISNYINIDIIHSNPSALNQFQKVKKYCNI